MAIPDYQTLMLPLLLFLADGKEHIIADAIEHLPDKYGLSSAERQQLLPRGKQSVIRNRVGWARTYMKQAGLI
jgi:restriction system protein